MDPGARADRRTDGRTDTRRHGGQLALRRASATRPALFAAALLLTAVAGAAAAQGTVSASRAAANSAAAPASYAWHLPRGFPTPAVPADNPMSDSKVALGERLFFDVRLSVTGSYSCASCHDPGRAFT